MSWAMADVVQRRRMIDEGEADEGVKRVERAKLNALLGVCETTGCRRQALLAHFGEAYPGRCGHCDNCLTPAETFDGTEAAQKLLSAILRTGGRFGAVHLINLLRGEETEKITAAGHHKLPTFGVGTELDGRAWHSVVRQLTAMGVVAVNHRAYGAIVPGDGYRSVLKGERRISLRKEADRRATRDRRAAKAAVGLPPEAEPLFQALRAERTRLAKEQGLPPYVVFHDSTLRELAVRRPTRLAELSTVPGIGRSKVDRYGAAILGVIAAAG
jgi:ATP-dependent DNA helicase RecQ